MTSTAEAGPGEALLGIGGRRLGRRARVTRRRLLDATVAQLQEKGIRDLRVADVARQAGTSPAAFYQYFRDVEEAVLALAEEAGERIAALARLLDEPWRGEAGRRAARQLVEGFTDFWDADRAILRSRNLAAQEGDRRFADARNRSLAHVTDPLAERIAEAQAAGRVAADVHPFAAAAALVAMVERMAAFRDDLGISRAEMVDTVARIVHQTVTGRRS